MNVKKFKLWLEFNGKPRSTIQNRISNCRNVENYEGDLDQHFANDYGLSILDKLSYSTEDERNNLAPKHNITINGNIRTGSATLKQAVTLYMNFKKDNSNDFEEYYNNSLNENQFINEEDFELTETLNNFSYESDLKNAMISQINEFFPDYKIFGNNEGVEYQIEGKRIDILLEKNDGSLLVVELKAGVTNYKVIGQILMYIGLLTEKFPDREIQGCIIAGEIDNTLKNASKTVKNVSLKSYQMKLELRNE